MKPKARGRGRGYIHCSKRTSERQDNNLSVSVLSLSPSEACKIINLQNTKKRETTIPSIPCSPFNYFKYIGLCYEGED